MNLSQLIRDLSSANAQYAIDSERSTMKKFKPGTSGSFATVHKTTLVRDVGSPPELVAVKRLRYTVLSNAEKKAIRELCVLTRVPAHPNICKFIGLSNWNGKGEERDLPALVLEWVDFSMTSYLEDHPGEKLEKILQACLGIRHLHENNFIHGDVKPNNFGIDASGIVKVLDFGLSKLEDVKGFSTVLRRNPRYTAPEILVGDGSRSPTFSSDVWGFGMSILQILHGRELVPDRSGRFFDMSFPYNHMRSESWDLVQVVTRREHPKLEMYRNVAHFTPLLVRIWEAAAHRPTIQEVYTILRSITHV